MKSYDSRTYSLNDFVEWEASGQLELNPRFQRRPVWTDHAKSYLMDTIVRGKPVPKFFIRQKINVSTKKSVREVVDGQQRLRTILSFIKDGFVISRKHNKEFGGKPFSLLTDDQQEQILSYEVSVDLLINLPDSEILDIFSRLNSYAVTLNQQEKLNADHFGPFKVLSDRVAHKYYDYWIKEKLVSPKAIMRMQEVSLVADLIIAMTAGIKSKKQVKKFYDDYEINFDFDTDILEADFDAVIAKIVQLFPEGVRDTEFVRPHIYYSLFTAVAHCLEGIPRLTVAKADLSAARIAAARNGLDRVGAIFATEDVSKLPKDQQQFLNDARRATTDESVRERRTVFLVDLMRAG